jgi:hypothetical protein
MMQTSVIEAPQAPLPDPVFEPGTLPPWETLPPQVTFLIVAFVIGGMVVLFGPLLKAWARRIEHGGRGDPALRQEVADLRARLDEIETRALSSGEVDAADHRFYQMEERVEFVERLLARGKEPGGAP